MADATPVAPVESPEAVRDEWVRAVEGLVREVEGWCRANGWVASRLRNMDTVQTQAGWKHAQHARAIITF